MHLTCSGYTDGKENVRGHIKSDDFGRVGREILLNKLYVSIKLITVSVINIGFKGKIVRGLRNTAGRSQGQRPPVVPARLGTLAQFNQ
jgi:hypothetical protein